MKTDLEPEILHGFIYFDFVVRTTNQRNAIGSHTHNNSLIITLKPQLEKKGLIPIGATSIGVHGKKYLVLSNGDNKAIPNPPLVNASRIP